MKNFRYALDPVLAKNQWDLDAAGAELAAARRHQAACEDAVTLTRRKLAELWFEFERVRAVDGGMALHKEAALRLYGERLGDTLHQQLARQRDAQALAERLADRTREALQVVRGMEHHKDRLRGEHDTQLRQLSQKEADDDWLLSHPAPLEDSP